MKKIALAFIFILIYNTISSAQTDTPSEGLRIKAIDTSSFSPSKFPLKLSDIKGFTNKAQIAYFNIKPIDGFSKRKSGVNITKKRDVVAPTWDIKQKFSENQKDVSKYSRDYYLGDIKTKSRYLRIMCRDHEYEDGDRVKLILNGAVIHPNIALRNSGYIIDIEINDGFNTIEFVALNEGSSSPNTAELKVYDENERIIASSQWLLTTGYKASLIVLKE
ncbi:hypothetical protein [Pontimicrobium sp. IMCC45349]|uniref:hypothetical protein n=1 Tax=Pontimicrobium sp. IMCC45349 TaxID=3391574 RepID=UPI0039A1C88E